MISTQYAHTAPSTTSTVKSPNHNSLQTPYQSSYQSPVQSPNSRQAKRKNKRERRSTIEKPNAMFKPKKKITFGTFGEYHVMSISAPRNKAKTPTIMKRGRITTKRKDKKLTLKLQRTLSEQKANNNSHPNDIKKILVNTKLIEFSCNNPSTEFLICSLLKNGWFLPKKKETTYRCKIHSYVTCSTLPQCLNYTFQELYKYQWVHNIYMALMMQLTLSQKALLFAMGADRKNRKKKLVSTIKDCFVGKQGVDWMLDNLMAKTRKEAIILGKKMLNATYLSHVSNAEDFQDNDFLYHFHEDTINYDIFANTRAPKIPPPSNSRHLTPISQNRHCVTPKTPKTPKTPRTPQSNYGNTPKPAMVNECSLHTRYNKHNEMMQCLVGMTIDVKVQDEYKKDIEFAFYLPSSTNDNKYICKIVDYVSFDESSEAIEFILNEFWEEQFSQNIYDELISKLSVAQKCKLMSIGIEKKTKKYRLKKYKHCISGKQGINWLIDTRFVCDIESALSLTNCFCDKGLIKSLTNSSNKFKNDNNLFYIFDIKEIDNQSTHLLSQKPKISPFINHDKLIQNLIAMSMSPMAELDILLDLSKAFYLPRSQEKGSKFISKFHENLIFDNIIEALHFILMENWNEDYSQIVYHKLLTKLSLAQKAKLFSLGIERKTRKKNFKKYKDCIIGNEAVEFLVDKGFCSNNCDALQIGNEFWCKGFIKHVNDQYAFKDEHIFYIFNDIEINKQCIMESYSKNVSYVNISPCTKISSESNNSFPDIDYDVTDVNKVKSYEIISDNDEKKEESLIMKEPSFPDISQFHIHPPARTPPIKIKQKMCKSSKHHHHELINLSIYSNVAVRGGYRYDSVGSIGGSMYDLNDIAIISSETATTPEPQIEDDEYFSSTTPSATPNNDDNDDNDDNMVSFDELKQDNYVSNKNSTPYKHRKHYHDPMATRITIPDHDEMDDDEINDDSLMAFELHDTDNLDGILAIECDNKSNHGIKSLLPPSLTIDVNTTDDGYNNNNNLHQTSASITNHDRNYYHHHVISSTVSMDDLQMVDSIIFAADNANTLHANDHIYNNNNNPFVVSYTPNQIGK